LDDLKETGRYWKLKEGALVHTLWRIHFERQKADDDLIRKI